MYDDATGKTISDPSDATGYPTIGIGHKLTSTELKRGTIKIGEMEVDWQKKLTPDQTKELVLQDLKHAVKAVEKNVDVELTQNQFDALVSFAFNIGSSAFKNAGAIKALNAGNMDDFLRRHAQWNKSNGRKMAGLVNRRASEAELFKA